MRPGSSRSFMAARLVARSGWVFQQTIGADARKQAALFIGRHAGPSLWQDEKIEELACTSAVSSVGGAFSQDCMNAKGPHRSTDLGLRLVEQAEGVRRSSAPVSVCAFLLLLQKPLRGSFFTAYRCASSALHARPSAGHRR